MRAIKYVLLSAFLLAYSCGPGGSGLPPAGGGGGGFSAAAIIVLTATPDSLSVGDASTIEASVIDVFGAPVDDGTEVTFTLLTSGLGSLSSGTATTTGGVASITFTAGTSAGTAVIAASSGFASATVSIAITLVNSITLTAVPDTITVLGSSLVTATLTSGLGDVPDGTVVTFSLSDTALGTIAATATTVDNVATAVFTAKNLPGTAVITGTSGLSDTVSILINPAAATSIEFDSATPNVIAIKGTGDPQTSLIKFLVKDANGNLVPDGYYTVDFVMSGPGGGKAPSAGGEYIGEDDGTPTEVDEVPTVGGIASVYLHSGNVAGPVTIFATITDSVPPITSASTPISIGGGVPNDAHLTIATNKWNLEGLNYAGITATLTVFMADRFGNYNVLEGHSMSFTTESGAVDTSVVTANEMGTASVTYRTQNPIPVDVEPEEWEEDLQDYVDATYGIVTSSHPRDGWSTIIVSTRGEESFNDTNANGLFDGADTYTDTPEAFLDVNDNGTRDADPFEYYIDDNGSDDWDDETPDSGAAAWDDDKTIFEPITLLITGTPEYIATDAAGFSIEDGASETFTLLVSDRNLNPLIGGTTVAVAALNNNVKVDFTSYSFPDVFLYGPVERTFSLTGQNVGASGFTVTVTYKGTKYERTFTGDITSPP